MIQRRQRIRRVIDIPIIKGFKPYGNSLEGTKELETITLLYEEYEALRLCDYEGYNHNYASQFMHISRPTFTRIYASAREKIAKALVEGKQLIIEGGKVYFDSDWYFCEDCKCNFNNPEKEISIEKCPLCNSNHIDKVEEEGNDKSLWMQEGKDFLCPTCGYKHRIGYRSAERNKKKHCPHCKARLRYNSDLIYQP